MRYLPRLFSPGKPQRAKPANSLWGPCKPLPFVSAADDGRWSGVSIDLWKQIADALDLEFEFREYDYDVSGLLQAVEHSQVDAILAPLPVTAPTRRNLTSRMPISVLV